MTLIMKNLFNEKYIIIIYCSVHIGQNILTLSGWLIKVHQHVQKVTFTEDFDDFYQGGNISKVLTISSLEFLWRFVSGWSPGETLE